MSSPRGRKAATSETISKEEAQRRFLEARTQGLTVSESATRALRTPKVVEYWRKTDEAFRDRADQAAEAGRAGGSTADRDISFPDFCEKYLGMRLFDHQLQWYDILEGREPRDLHPAMTYKAGDPTRIVVNTPPFHAKTMTISISWITYRVCMDPSVRVLIVSKTQDFAKKILGAVKNRLTHPQYRALQAAFGPQGGFQASASEWTKDQIRLGGEDTDATEKDPTVQALGIEGQIYGARADIIIMDDCITKKNAHQWEAQLEWLNTEVDSRLEEDTGILAIVGTRISPEDLYVKLRDPEDFSEAEDDTEHDGEADERPWTYLAQPAVLEYADRKADWVTLWPRATVPWGKGTDPDEDGLFDRWGGVRLAKKRARGARIWSLVYQQADVSDVSVFTSKAVHATVEPRRNMGALNGKLPGHRREGMDGLYVVAGLDPAGAGYTAMIVLGIDRATGMRYVLYAVNESRMAPHVMRRRMIDLTDQLGVQEWVIEKNAYQSSIIHDEEIIAPLRERGARIEPTFTGAQKWDEDFGVAAMAPLFGEYDDHGRLVLDPKIELASTQNAHAMKSLVEQLITWQPKAPKTQKTDLVMALWFAETRARDVSSLARRNRNTHMPSRFASPRRVARAGVVDLRDYIGA